MGIKPHVISPGPENLLLFSCCYSLQSRENKPEKASKFESTETDKIHLPKDNKQIEFNKIKFTKL